MCALQTVGKFSSPPVSSYSQSPVFLLSFLCLVLSCLKACQWPCFSLCGRLCHRWSITTGGSLLLAKPCGPADPDKSVVNASPQPRAMIGSDRHSGPYASLLPPRPQKPGVGRYVCVCTISTALFSTCCWGFMSPVFAPLFLWLKSTQCRSQLCVCTWMRVSLCMWVHVPMWKCHTQYTAFSVSTCTFSTFPNIQP